VGDVNADGLDDFALASTVIYGKRESATLDFFRLGSGGFSVLNSGFCPVGSCEALDSELTGAGDLDSDGRDDLLYGDANAGNRRRGGTFVLLSAGPPKVVVAPFAQTKRVGKSGVVSLPSLCPVTTVGACRGTLSLSDRAGRRLARRRPFTIEAGRFRKVRVSLSRALRLRLRRMRRVGLRVETVARNSVGMRAVARRELVLQLLTPRRRQESRR